jgi:hypothetical protein
MQSEISTLIDRAHGLVRKHRKTYIIYRRNDRLTLISLKTYLDADLDSKGAKRIVSVTQNAAGEVI